MSFEGGNLSACHSYFHTLMCVKEVHGVKTQCFEFNLVEKWTKHVEDVFDHDLIFIPLHIDGVPFAIAQNQEQHNFFVIECRRVRLLMVGNA
jgi:hypothetical protein